eukprot:1213303-Rhodomonas_salina.1
MVRVVEKWRIVVLGLCYWTFRVATCRIRLIFEKLEITQRAKTAFTFVYTAHFDKCLEMSRYIGVG